MDQSNLNNSLQINDSVISSSSSPPTDHQLNNYKNLKPIDSVDSISEIKSPISTNPKTFSKFDNINEDVSGKFTNYISNQYYLNKNKFYR